MGIEPFLITASVIMVGSQRLVRRLCDHCKEAYKPSETELKLIKAKATEKLTFYRPNGCEKCEGRGYAGRVCVAELLMISKEIRRLILENASEQELQVQARKEGMVTLRENCVMKVREGVTSIDEAIRVSINDED
jgi:type II secretory ATPase GspE/PulE/Tfp pilus assembly ATPase PilB-like protein